MVNWLNKNRFSVTVILLLVIVFTSFIWATSISVSNAKQRLKERAKRLEEIVENRGSLREKNLRSFMYVYDPSTVNIDVTDGSWEDWKELNQSAVKRKRLSLVSEFSSSWLDQTFKGDASSYGTYVTPYLANTIHLHDAGPSFDLSQFKPDFRLRVARDDESRTLYILGHLVIETKEGDSVVTRLTVHDGLKRGIPFALLLRRMVA